MKRGKGWQALRWYILKRDNYTCQYCGQKAPDVILHVDHIIEVTDGGTDDPANLKTACSSCNQGKENFRTLLGHPFNPKCCPECIRLCTFCKHLENSCPHKGVIGLELRLTQKISCGEFESSLPPASSPLRAVRLEEIPKEVLDADKKGVKKLKHLCHVLRQCPMTKRKALQNSNLKASEFHFLLDQLIRTDGYKIVEHRAPSGQLKTMIIGRDQKWT